MATKDRCPTCGGSKYEHLCTLLHHRQLAHTANTYSCIRCADPWHERCSLSNATFKDYESQQAETLGHEGPKDRCQDKLADDGSIYQCTLETGHPGWHENGGHEWSDRRLRSLHKHPAPIITVSNGAPPGVANWGFSENIVCLPKEGAPQPAPSHEDLVIEIARELYDRFVMGGWDPQDAYPQIREWLAEVGDSVAQRRATIDG